MNNANASSVAGQQLHLLSVLLREPQHRCVQILRQHRNYQLAVESRRHTRLGNSTLARLRDSFQLPQLTALRELVHRDSRSRILVSFHFGEFAYALSRIVSLLSAQQGTVILTQRAMNPELFDNTRRAFGADVPEPQDCWLLEHTRPRQLIARLRAESCCLTMLCDLPQEFGATVTVRFLGRAAEFPRGPATIALAANVPLLPVISYFDGRCNQIRFHRQIESQPRQGESRPATVQRITQQLVNIVEAYLLRYPAQWRFLASLPVYFNTRGPVPA